MITARPLAVLLLLAGLTPAQGPVLVDRPVRPGEWGWRPVPGATVELTPPAFAWPPTQGVVRWELEVCMKGRIVHRARNITLPVHCPPRALPAGNYAWRYMGVDGKGRKSTWSRWRPFSIAPDAASLPLPERQDLLARIPEGHPRLFVRPEDLEGLRTLAGGAQKARAKRLYKLCDKLLANPPPTAEPPRYSQGMRRGSDPWRKVWWGNRRYTIRTLEGAATLAFGSLLSGRADWREEARRLLMACARWDPVGSTGYRYNDEAGMPYAYHFARAYTFLHGTLTPAERKLCRQVLTIRGREMYRHLCPRHLWRPYASHSNRAWHFLGEVGIALHGDVPEAADWVWFAANVFRCVYPVWSDSDGGWHEGTNYWRSYVGRFTWWADVMKSALGIDAFHKPYFARAGDYALYMLPPGKTGGGFGDLTARMTPRGALDLMTVLTAQSGNPHWRWWVEAVGGPKYGKGHIGFLRAVQPAGPAVPPTDLPTSRHFRGTGQAVLNSRLDDARQSVQVVFKSSPFGTQSHGYEANNSFLLWAYGQRLLIRSGYRDSYGSAHHRGWMWSTRSTNCITVDGSGQGRRTAAARGRILDFATGPHLDLVVGEAAGAYGQKSSLRRFTRTVVFLKPELVVVLDRLAADRPARYTWWLHGLKRFTVKGQDRVGLTVGDVTCHARFLLPRGLAFRQTDQYDPNPRARIKLREWHLTATPAEPRARETFLVALHPRRRGSQPPPPARVGRTPAGWLATFPLPTGSLRLFSPHDDRSRRPGAGPETAGHVVVQRLDQGGRILETRTARQHLVKPRQSL